MSSFAREESFGSVRALFPADVFPYTKEELSDPLVQEAFKNGSVLFARDFP